MKQQTFDIFADEQNREILETEVDLNLDTQDLMAIDKTLQIASNDTADLEEIDFDEQFATVNLNNEDDFNINVAINTPIVEEEIIKEEQAIEQTDSKDPIEVSINDESIEIDTKVLDDLSASTQDILGSGDFETLDTSQFSVELGEMNVSSDDDVLEINVEPEVDDHMTKDFGELQIMAIGAGGYGTNVISHVYNSTSDDIITVSIDTDANRLEDCKAHKKILIGERLLGGNGSGKDNRKVIEAIHEIEPQIRELLQGKHILFLTANLVGTTGCNVIAEVGRISREMGILTIGFVMAPLRQQASSSQIQEVYNELVDILDSTILVDSEIILSSYGNLLPNEVEEKVDNVLVDGIRGVYDLATRTGLINLDYADICTAFRDRGAALMSIAYGEGENNIVDAITKALNPTVIDSSILESAQMAIVGIKAPRKTVTIKQASEASLKVSNMNKNEDKLVLFGWTIDDSLMDKVQATVIISSSAYQTIHESSFSNTHDFLSDDLNEFLDSLMNESKNNDVISALDIDMPVSNVAHNDNTDDKFSGFDLNSAPFETTSNVVSSNDDEYPNFFD